MGAKEDHDTLSKMAEWLGIKDEAEMTDFIDKAMTMRGHKQTKSWVDSEDSDKGSKGGGLLGGSGKKSDTANWQYGS